MLTGDLKDYSLREILQFLATTSSSGVLELHNVESHAGIAFRDGGICLALLDMDGVQGLAARMVRAGGVDVPRLQALGAEHSGDAVDLAAALATETAAHAGAAEVFREHTYETLGWLTRRDEASFLFEGSEQLEDWPFDVANLDAVLEIVDDRADAWQELADTVSDLTRICSPVPEVTEVDEISLTAEQWRVLSLVDGRRPLKDLIELSGIGHLETCRHLHQLVAAGIVELVAADGASSLDQMVTGLDALRPRGPTTSAAVPLTRADGGRPAFYDAAEVDERDGVAVVTAPVAPGPATDEPATSIAAAGTSATTHPSGTGEVEGLDSDANRALFDRLLGDGGAPT